MSSHLPPLPSLFHHHLTPPRPIPVIAELIIRAFGHKSPLLIRSDIELSFAVQLALAVRIPALILLPATAGLALRVRIALADRLISTGLNGMRGHDAGAVAVVSDSIRVVAAAEGSRVVAKEEGWVAGVSGHDGFDRVRVEGRVEGLRGHREGEGRHRGDQEEDIA
jgi:hypothetical protein